jgi:hypothetical protein
LQEMSQRNKEQYKKRMREGLHESYLYEVCVLPSVCLFGLTVDHCQGCNKETVSIPRIRDLHRALARAVLLKPAALTGRELRVS